MTSPSEQEQDEVDTLLFSLIDQLEKGNLELPVLPRVVNQVLALTTNPDVDTATLSALIQQDQVLASKILRIANSPAYLPRSPIESLNQAIAWIGLHLLAGTTFCLSVQSGVFNDKGYETELKGLWRHSIAVGLYSKAIAERLGTNPDSAFLGGLLHAIGKPFIVHTINQYRRNAASLLAWPLMVLIIKDAYIEVGRELAVAWDFPVPVKEAILFHQDHAYHKATTPMKYAAMTCLANHLTSFLFEPSSIEEEALLALPVAQHLQVSETDMKAFVEMQDTIRASVETMLV